MEIGFAYMASQVYQGNGLQDMYRLCAGPYPPEEIQDHSKLQVWTRLRINSFANALIHGIVCKENMNTYCVLIYIIFSLHSVVEDMRTCKVKVLELLIGTVLSATVQILLDNTRWTNMTLGAAAGFFPFYCIHRIAKGRLGAGDIYLSVFTGVSFGFWTWDIGLLVGCVFAFAYILLHRIVDRGRPINEIKIPFAPFIFGGALVGSILRSTIQ